MSPTVHGAHDFEDVISSWPAYERLYDARLVL
jgi:hypothetical protein